MSRDHFTTDTTHKNKKSAPVSVLRSPRARLVASLLPAATARQPAAGTRVATTLATARATALAPPAAPRSARLAEMVRRQMDKFTAVAEWLAGFAIS